MIIIDPLTGYEQMGLLNFFILPPAYAGLGFQVGRTIIGTPFKLIKSIIWDLPKKGLNKLKK